MIFNCGVSLTIFENVMPVSLPGTGLKIACCSFCAKDANDSKNNISRYNHLLFIIAAM
jgi:hypothetical protein